MQGQTIAGRRFDGHQLAIVVIVVALLAVSAIGLASFDVIDDPFADSDGAVEAPYSVDYHMRELDSLKFRKDNIWETEGFNALTVTDATTNQADYVTQQARQSAGPISVTDLTTNRLDHQFFEGISIWEFEVPSSDQRAKSASAIDPDIGFTP